MEIKNHQGCFFENLFSNGLVVFKLIFKLNKREVPTCHRKIIKVVMCVWPSPLPGRAQMRPASLFDEIKTHPGCFFENPTCHWQIIKVLMRDLNVRPAPPRLGLAFMQNQIK